MMKSIAIAVAVLFSLVFIAPVFAENVATGDLCNPKKMEECKTKIDTLLKSVDSLRSKLLKSQMEINAGRKLTNEEADRMLKNIESTNQSLPATEGYMWDN
jgi:parvulin-like peptidyl-prolyl isomerase